jgi:DNA-binding XRE family transcriptional regulator
MANNLFINILALNFIIDEYTKINNYSTSAIINHSFFAHISIVERKLIFDESGLKAFAQRLKEVRKIKNFSQEELAYKSGLSLSQIARIETAKTNPTLSTIFRIARTMEVKLPELFDFSLPYEK